MRRPCLRGRERGLFAAPRSVSTELAIFCAYRLGGPAAAVIGGLGFIVPAVVMVLGALGALPVVGAAGSAARSRGRGRRRRRGRGRARGWRADRPSYEHATGGSWPSSSLARLPGGRYRGGDLVLGGLVLVLVACGSLMFFDGPGPAGTRLRAAAPPALLDGARRRQAGSAPSPGRPSRPERSPRRGLRGRPTGAGGSPRTSTTG